MPKVSLSLLVLRSANPSATLGFYETLGLDFVEEKHGGGPVHFSCNIGDWVLEIYPASSESAFDAKASGATMLGFGVESLDAVLAELQKRNIEPTKAPQNAPWGRWVNVCDPDGRVVQLSKETHAASGGALV